MDTLLIIVILLLLFGGGGGLYWGMGAGWGIGPIGLIVAALGRRAGPQFAVCSKAVSLAQRYAGMECGNMADFGSPPVMISFVSLCVTLPRYINCSMT